MAGVGFKKALLIYPATGLFVRDDRCQTPIEGMTAQPNKPPMDLAYMAAVLERQGVECQIRDYAAENAVWSQYDTDFRAFMPDLLVVSVTTPTLHRDLETCREAKKLNPRVTTVGKGAHFSAKDEQVFLDHPELDIAIRNDSEMAIEEIAAGMPLDQIKGLTFKRDSQVFHTEPRPFINEEEFDNRPFPARHLLKNELYTSPDTGEALASIDTGRGCPHACVFCAVAAAAGRRLKMRTPAKIVDEVEECVTKHGIKTFYFRADTFTWDEDWTVEVCREIIRRDLKIRWGANSRVDTISEKRVKWMKEAGCWLIGFGVESGTQESLDKMKKRATLQQARDAIALCKRYDINTYGMFLIGLPWETKQHVEKTIDFILELDPTFIDVNVAYPLPNTEYYTMAQELGLFEQADLFAGDYSKPIVRTEALGSTELMELRKKALRKFYLRPSYVMNTLKRVRSPKVFMNYATNAARLVKQIGLPILRA
jgi:anaerobic magnesium-protoporphyrin IX monomethyl ester cyclase